MDRAAAQASDGRYQEAAEQRAGGCLSVCRRLSSRGPASHSGGGGGGRDCCLCVRVYRCTITSSLQHNGGALLHPLPLAASDLPASDVNVRRTTRARSERRRELGAVWSSGRERRYTGKDSRYKIHVPDGTVE